MTQLNLEPLQREPVTFDTPESERDYHLAAITQIERTEARTRQRQQEQRAALDAQFAQAHLQLARAKAEWAENCRAQGLDPDQIQRETDALMNDPHVGNTEIFEQSQVKPMARSSLMMGIFSVIFWVVMLILSPFIWIGKKIWQACTSKKSDAALADGQNELRTPAQRADLGSVVDTGQGSLATKYVKF